MEYGLTAAIGWGVSSVAATHAARRMGTLAALLASQITGTIVLTGVLAAAAAGWLVSALIVYIISVTVLLAALICKHQRPEGGVAGAAWAIAAGLTEVAALVAFARGGQAGQVAVTAAVSSTYPVIPLAAGLLLFRERLSALQVFGIGVAVAGLTLVSMSTRLA